MNHTLFLDGIGIFAPGIPDWPTASNLLRTKKPLQQISDELSGGSLPAYPSDSLLPQAERRRAADSVRLALEAARQACQHAQIDPDLPATIFASSSGDTHVLSNICETLASADRQLSPTRFHNSVHNAAAGYWHIAVKSHQPSTSIAWHHHTAGSGLLEAATQIATGNTPVLLVIYDMPFPFPLANTESIPHAFGCALLLQPAITDRSLAQLAWQYDATNQPSHHDASVTLRTNTPAAHVLPLLNLLAHERAGTLSLTVPTQGRLILDVSPLRQTGDTT